MLSGENGEGREGGRVEYTKNSAGAREEGEW